MNNNRKKPSKQELEALNKVVDFNKESNDSKKDVIYTPAKDENLENETREQKRLRIKQERLKAREDKLTQIFTRDPNQIVDFLNTEPPKVIGLCKRPGWDIPKGVTTTISGSGGTGKSSYSLEKILCFACGVNYGYWEPIRPYKILAVFGEDDLNIVHIRAKKAIKLLHLEDKVDLLKQNLYFISVAGWGFELVKYQNRERVVVDDNMDYIREYLEREIKYSSPVDILLLDPLSQFYGLNENDNGDAKFFLNDTLGEFCKYYGTTNLLVNHTSKDSRKLRKGEENIPTSIDTFDSMVAPRGASAFVDNSRYNIGLLKFQPGDAKKFNIPQNERKKYVIVKPSKVNYTEEVSEFMYLKRVDGVLIPCNPQRDLNNVIEEKLERFFKIYYSAEYESYDWVEFNKEGIPEIKKSAPLPPIQDRPRLSVRDIQYKTKDEVKDVLELLHEILKEVGLGDIQKNLPPRITALERDGIISFVQNRNRTEIIYPGKK